MRILQILCKNKSEKLINLAEEFEVSKRTIQNDVEILSYSFPVYSQTGKYGGIFIDKDYIFGMIYLTDKQLTLLKKVYFLLTDEEDIITLNTIITTYKNPKR